MLLSSIDIGSPRAVFEHEFEALCMSDPARIRPGLGAGKCATRGRTRRRDFILDHREDWTGILEHRRVGRLLPSRQIGI